MKNVLPSFLFVLTGFTATAHDHIETRLNPQNPDQLSVFGDFMQTATFFPLGEAPSLALENLPGGAYASELTFSAFDNTAPPPKGALVRVDVLSVTGPEGGNFSYWETAATTPTWTRPSGWSASENDHPDLYASEDAGGYGHLHGRAFTMDRAGVYLVTFQVVDELGNHAASAPFVVQFTAIDPPRLSIALEASSVLLTFQSRMDLNYDLQSSTTLDPYDWSFVETLEGDGGQVQFSEPLGGRPKVFYRLVEY
jgi:hypothetical protein